MLIPRLLLATFAVATTAGASRAEPKPPATRVVLRSAYFSPGLPLVETAHAVYAVHIEVHVDAKGEGRGRLTLMTTPPNYDEYGDLVSGTETDLIDRTRRNGKPPVVLDCAFPIH
jgi:hypothetical protein